MPSQEQQETRTGHPASSSTIVKRALEPDPRLLEPKIEEDDIPQEVIKVDKKKKKKKRKLNEVKVKEEETEIDREGQTVTVFLNEPAEEDKMRIDESGNVIFAPGRVPQGAEPPVNPLKKKTTKAFATRPCWWQAPFQALDTGPCLGWRISLGAHNKQKKCCTQNHWKHVTPTAPKFRS